MSEPKRYTDLQVWETLHFAGSTNGWVQWQDYARLKAEVERLRASSFVTAVPVEEYEKLKAEVDEARRCSGEGMKVMLGLSDDLVAENARLKAEVERLNALVESNLNSSKVAMGKADAVLHERDSLKAELARLRKAGDAMAERCLKMQYTEVPWEYGPKWYAWHSKAEASVQAWNAAKEGNGQP